MSQPIYIIGAGAVGKVLAVALSLENKDVILVRGSVDEAPDHTEKILVELGNSRILEAAIRVSTLACCGDMRGTVVLTSKSFGNDRLSRLLSEKMSLRGRANDMDAPLVILQNGLGIERSFVEKGFPGIYRCVLFVTSQFVGENRLQFKPVSVCPIGIVKGDLGRLDQIVETLHTPHFQFRAEADIQPVIWKKAIANCVFNSICPLLETDNGIFHRRPEALDLAKRVIEECVLVARAMKIDLDTDSVVQNVLQISKASDGQLISTLQDIRNNRRTEIETLNFEIARLARSLDMDGLVKETRLLGELTLLKSMHGSLK
jgi:2-dehydropantoate 2-reductase